MPFSRPRVLTASTISADMASVSHEVRTTDVGVRDRDDAGVRGHRHPVVGRPEQLAGKGVAAFVPVSRAQPRAAADIAAEVPGLAEGPLDAGARRLERIPLAPLGQVMRDALAEVQRDALRVIDEKANEIASYDLGEQHLDFGLRLCKAGFDLGL